MRLALSRLFQLLTFWMALTFVIVPTMSAVFLGAMALVQAPVPAGAWNTLAQMAWLVPAGGALFCLAHLTGDWFGDQPMPGGWSGTWKRAIRAVLLPGADDELHDFTVYISQTEAQVRGQLQALPAPRLGLSGALTRRKGQAMAKVEGGQITIIAGMGAAGDWRGQLENAGALSIARGALASKNRSGKFDRFFNFVVAIGAGLASICLMIGAFTSPKARASDLLAFLIICGILLQFAVISRIHRFLAREHERALERFWRETFAARVQLARRKRDLFDV